jgi:hypothetical protein
MGNLLYLFSFYINDSTFLRDIGPELSLLVNEKFGAELITFETE